MHKIYAAVIMHIVDGRLCESRHQKIRSPALDFCKIVNLPRLLLRNCDISQYNIIKYCKL